MDQMVVRKIKLGILSDTHDNLSFTIRWVDFFKGENVDGIVHLGDNNSPFIFKNVFNKFQGKGYAVLGNNDGDRILISNMAYNFNIKIAEQIMIQEIDGLRMLLMHGFGSPEQTKLIAHSFAKSRDYDVVLYGHTHEALIENLNGILVVNPGEAGGILTGKPTAAIMQTKPLSIRIVSLP